MARVTRLVVQERRKDRVDVHLDDATAFSVSLDLAATLGRGQELDEAAVAALRAEDEVATALGRALGFLAHRPRSRQEVGRYLAGKGVAPEAAERVLARLADLGLVDDAAFAAWWVENRGRHRPRGARALGQELAMRGVARDLVRDAVAGLDEDGLAVELALARAERYRGLAREAFDRRLGGLLARRGFGHEAVAAALERAWRHLDGG